MIVGIGVDSVEVHRFSEWHIYGEKKLLRIFSDEEIRYCLANRQNSAERFAARFAAKEAFFKAFSAAFTQACVPFLTVCRHVSVQKIGDRPVLCVEWDGLQCKKEVPFVCHLSLTHTKTVATAFVMIEQPR